MPAEKYSASMDSELLAQVRQAAEDEDVTLSAFLADAAKRRVDLLVAEKVLNEWERENGAFTEEELAEADRRLFGGGMTPEEAVRWSQEQKEKGLDRNDRRQWALLRRSVRAGLQPVIPAPVVAQAWRSGRQANLAQALKACVVEVVDEGLAREAGALCARARTSDAIDAIVVASAARRGSTVHTSDIDDISRLAAHVKGVEVEPV